MPRFLKKLLYAILYLGIFGLGAVGIFGISALVRERPVPLAPPAPTYALEIRSADMYTAGGDQLFVFGELVNPYLDMAAARVGYEFAVSDSFGIVRERITGTARVFAGERLFVYAPVRLVQPKDAGGVTLSVAGAEWQPADLLPSSRLRVEGEPSLRIDGSVLTVAGTLRNDSSFEVRDVQAIAVVSDVFGFRLLVHGTYVSFVPSLTAKSFQIVVPVPPALAEKALQGSVEVLLHPAL